MLQVDLLDLQSGELMRFEDTLGLPSIFLPFQRNRQSRQQSEKRNLYLSNRLQPAKNFSCRKPNRCRNGWNFP